MKTLKMNQLQLEGAVCAALGLGVMLGGELDRGDAFLDAHVNRLPLAVGGFLIVIALGLRLAAVWIDRKSGRTGQTAKTP
jgi:hypothetical protein